MTKKNPTHLSHHIRQRKVEELYLNGYKAAEIHKQLANVHPVTAATIRNDIWAVRKRWKEAVLPERSEDGREQYFASLHSVRRKALSGWQEESPAGPKVRGRDFKLVHDIDKEIARMNGVPLKSDILNIDITVEKARDYLDAIMGIVFTHVTDKDARQSIVDDLAKLDGQQ